MLKISSREIIDVVRFEELKAIVVEKVPMLDDFNKYKVNYFVINFASGEKEVITKNAYLRKKFGSNYQAITEKVGNFVQCDAQVLPNKNVLVIYPGGQAGLFDTSAELIKEGLLSYNDSPAFGIANDGDYFWSCCTAENCVIRYLADGIKVDIRIGGKESATFPNPNYVTADSSYVYVCCEHNRVRRIDKANFSVSDMPKTYDDLQRYYKFGDYSIVCTSNSAYIDRD